MNKIKKLLTIVGARPQFVKAAVISRRLSKFNSEDNPGEIKEIIVHTGQHHDDNMSEIFFREMCIPKPDYNLGISNCSHGAMTGRMIEHIERVLDETTPDAVLVYGDTNSTLAGALAAAKVKIPVAHIEAGLRSFNKGMPEEINRVMTDHISTLLFCPTANSVNNLHAEGIGTDYGKDQALVYETGDIMLSATEFYSKRAEPGSRILNLIKSTNNNYHLATIHREENTSDYKRLNNIFRAFDYISKTTPVILPIHPRTRHALSKFNIYTGSVLAIDPVGYFDMLTLIKNCKAVLTDSGGVQKEAFFMHKPCITLRDETEWVELVEHGFNTVAGTNAEAIIEAMSDISRVRHNFTVNLYGRGDADEQIVAALSSYLRGR